MVELGLSITALGLGGRGVRREGEGELLPLNARAGLRGVPTAATPRAGISRPERGATGR